MCRQKGVATRSRAIPQIQARVRLAPFPPRSRWPSLSLRKVLGWQSHGDSLVDSQRVSAGSPAVLMHWLAADERPDFARLRSRDLCLPRRRNPEINYGSETREPPAAWRANSADAIQRSPLPRSAGNAGMNGRGEQSNPD